MKEEKKSCCGNSQSHEQHGQGVSCGGNNQSHEQQHSCCGNSQSHEQQHSCCAHSGQKRHQTECGCGGKHAEGKSGIIKSIIILSISLPFLVTGYFDWHGIGFLAFYYVNPAWVTVALCGTPIVISAVKVLKNKKITASVLISVAMLAAISLEIVGFFVDIHTDGHNHSYVFAAGEVAFLMAVGGLIESITVKKTRSGIERLVGLIPKEAFVKTNDGLIKKSLSEISIGDIVIAKAGEMIAVDGEIISGGGTVDQSSVTGEYLPVELGVGDKVYGGTFNKSGVIEIRVTKLLKDMTVAKMAELVEEAAGKKAPIARVADKWASYIVPMAILSSFIVGILAGFAFKSGVVESIIRAITVLIVFCPCSLALATPTAIAAGLGNAAKNGVLIKSGESLETLSRANTICFDKTGTLTTGNIEIFQISTLTLSQQDFLQIIASSEMYSEHPLAAAILKSAAHLKLTQPKDIKVLQGIGIEANVNGKSVLVTNFRYALNNGYNLMDLAQKADEVLQSGKTVIVGIIDGKAEGIISFTDSIRQGAKVLVEQLLAKGYRVAMLTGDNEKSANYIAELAGISEVRHSLMPEEKLSVIKEMQNDGNIVCMVGDGINDAPSLKAADCSMAMGALGSDIAIETADMAILNSQPIKIEDTLHLSKRTLNTIRRNIIISMGINITAVVISLFGWLTPVTGALVHNFTSVFVVLSSALLLIKRRRKQ